MAGEGLRFKRKTPLNYISGVFLLFNYPPIPLLKVLMTAGLEEVLNIIRLSRPRTRVRENNRFFMFIHLLYNRIENL